MDEIIAKILELDELYAADCDLDRCIGELTELALTYKEATNA